MMNPLLLTIRPPGNAPDTIRPAVDVVSDQTYTPLLMFTTSCAVPSHPLVKAAERRFQFSWLDERVKANEDDAP